MESKPVRISEFSINEIREIAKDIGEPTDDTAIRHIIAEYKRLKLENEKLNIENELLKKKLEEVTDERNSFQMDLNMTILTKEREIEQLKKKLAECKKEN